MNEEKDIVKQEKSVKVIFHLDFSGDVYRGIVSDDEFLRRLPVNWLSRACHFVLCLYDYRLFI